MPWLGLTYGQFPYGGEEVSSFSIDVTGNGIASGEAFGNADIAREGEIFATGIASAEAFGSPEVGKQNIDATGVASGEAFGSPKISQTIAMGRNETVIVEDTFTGETSGTLLTAHTPDTDTVGGGWIDVQASLQLSSTRVEYVNNNDDEIAVIDIGRSKNYELSCDIYFDQDIGSSSWPGLVISSPANYPVMTVKVDGGYFTLNVYQTRYWGILPTHRVASTTNIVTGDEYNVKIRVDDNYNIDLFLDDVLEYRWDANAHDYLADWWEAVEAGGDYNHVGIFHHGDDTAWYDNFKVVEINESSDGIASGEAFGEPAVTHAAQTINLDPLLIFHDTFTEADDAMVNLDSHTPDVNLTGNTAWNTAWGITDIDDFWVVPGLQGALNDYVNNANGGVLTDMGVGNIEIQGHIWPVRDSVSEWPGYMFRGVDASNYLFVRAETTGSYMYWLIGKRDTGTDSTLASGVTQYTRGSSNDYRAGFDVRIVANGDTIDVYINGAASAEVSHTLTGGDETQFSAANGQYAGIYTDGAETGTKWGDFKLFDLDSDAYGIASAEAFGSPTVTSLIINVDGNGIASGEAVGTPSNVELMLQFVDVDSNGIASAEAFGSPDLTQIVKPTGITSGEAFGNHEVSLNQFIYPTGIASGEAFGNAAIGQIVDLDGNGIASGEAFGSVEKINQFIDATGIASGEAFGEPLVKGLQEIGVGSNGIASGEAFGNPDIGQVIDATGIASGEAFGDADLIQHIVGTGIASGEAVGTPRVVHVVDLDGNGIASAEAFGSPDLTQIIQATGIESGEAFGDFKITLYVEGAGGIESGEAFGTPQRVVITADGCIVQTIEVHSVEQAISVIEMAQTVSVVEMAQTVTVCERGQETP